ncbi:hypothetical protein [Polaribacter aestuariivivens]|uniref:hypothetical protein n=1 Tax=Polaribacter aestuariivivens TaxID=2304626 RepID=UPI003F4955B0
MTEILTVTIATSTVCTGTIFTISSFATFTVTSTIIIFHDIYFNVHIVDKKVSKKMQNFKTNFLQSIKINQNNGF